MMLQKKGRDREQQSRGVNPSHAAGAAVTFKNTAAQQRATEAAALSWQVKAVKGKQGEVRQVDQPSLLRSFSGVEGV